MSQKQVGAPPGESAVDWCLYQLNGAAEFEVSEGISTQKLMFYEYEAKGRYRAVQGIQPSFCPSMCLNRTFLSSTMNSFKTVARSSRFSTSLCDHLMVRDGTRKNGSPRDVDFLMERRTLMRVDGRVTSVFSVEKKIFRSGIKAICLRHGLLADIISTVEFNHTGELLATGDKGGRVVIFQREPESKNEPYSQGEYNVYSTFQSHEPEFDYLKSLEIEEKINKIKWLPQQNAAHSLLSTNDKTIKLWKITERDKRPEGYNLKDEEGKLKDLSTVTSLQVPVLKPMDLMVEVTPRRIFANGHTYHVNSISVNSDCETYMSADDLRINLWHLAITDRSFNIVDIKPANMEDLTEVITASEFHPHHCNLFVYSSSKGSLRLCDMRASALCDKHSKLYEEPEDPSNRSFFSEIISSVSDVKFSHSGRYMLTRDYLTVKVWDLNMETKPVETYQVHDYLRSKLCSLYENDCIFDKFECAWNGSDSVIMTGAYNNFFRMFDRNTKRDVTLEASRESSKPRAILKPRRVCVGGKRRKDDISVDSLDFTKKILHTAWHPTENIIAIAATNNLYIFQDKVNSEMH